MSFQALGLAEGLLSAVRDKGYTEASPVQAKAIPAILSGRDVLAAAQTGTGKTAGFALPLLQLLSQQGTVPLKQRLRVLIMTPTRELAAQVQDNIETYGAHLSFRTAVVFGGVPVNPQIKTLRNGIDILVATPGRLLDLHNQKAVDLSHVRHLVLDEADRMLDMGFIHDIRRIIRLLPSRRQNLMFSATFSQDIRALCSGLLHDPISVEVAARNTAAETVEQEVYRVEKADKPFALKHLIHEGQWEQVLVFTRTKHGADRLCKKLGQHGILAAAIHGNKSQGARTRALADFKAGLTRALVATDIAARGLDIKQLPHVVNYDLPNVSEDYVHRIGRTGRAGASGHAVSLVSMEENKLLKGIEKLLALRLKILKLKGFREQSTVERKAVADLQEQRTATAPQWNKKFPARSNGSGSVKHRSGRAGSESTHESSESRSGNRRKASGRRRNRRRP